MLRCRGPESKSPPQAIPDYRVFRLRGHDMPGGGTSESNPELWCREEIDSRPGPSPPTTIKNVAKSPKNTAPFGNIRLAVFTGFGQRRTLLRPLSRNLQPKIMRSIVSVISTIVE